MRTESNYRIGELDVTAFGVNMSGGYGRYGQYNKTLLRRDRCVVKVFDKKETEALELADMITNAIVKQFPHLII